MSNDIDNEDSQTQTTFRIYMLIIYRDIPWWHFFPDRTRRTWWCVLFCWRWRLDLMDFLETLDLSNAQWSKRIANKFRSIAPIKCGLSEPKLYLPSKFTSKYFHYYNFIKKIKKHTHNYKWPLFEADSAIFHTKKTTTTTTTPSH